MLQDIADFFVYLWKEIVEAFSNMNLFALIWPILLIAGVIFFFVRYRRMVRVKPDSLEWVEYLKKPRLQMTAGYGRLSRADVIPMIALTLIYGALALLIAPGENTAPQTFWHATAEQPSITLDLGEERQINAVLYYTGHGHKDWKLEFSEDGESWREQPSMHQTHAEQFKWKFAELEDNTFQDTRYVRITSQSPPMTLGEVAFSGWVDGQSIKLPTAGVTSVSEGASVLFDEQKLIPNRPTPQNGMIFDEIYHGRTAYEHINDIYPYETTHPPLGKLIISLGIRIFGMTPFGWRFMGILFGILMIPVMYLLLKSIFKKTNIAFLGTTLLAFESMHFTQTRLSTIDTYVVFFIMLMYLFMYRYISSGYDTPLKKTVWPLALCGLSWGLAMSSKWTAFYAAIGLVVLYVVYLVKRGRWQKEQGQSREFKRFLWGALGLSVVFFVLIPGVIYTLCYIPYVTSSHDQSLTLGNLLNQMWNNQESMYKYHGRVHDTHAYMSRWYMWIFDVRPILYYNYYNEGQRQLVAAFTNPLITLGGLFAFFATFLSFLQRRGKVALFLVVGYLAQLVPWMFISRIQFAYHYFASMIFLILMLCYVFNEMFERSKKGRGWVYGFVGASVVLFLMFLPIEAGLKMPDWYSSIFLRWLPSWPF